MPTSVKPQGVEHPLPTFALCLMPTSVKPKGVEHPLPTFALCLMPTSVKPKGVEHPERQKGADGATRLWYLGSVNGPRCPILLSFMVP